jgi:hypothetical protein
VSETKCWICSHLRIVDYQSFVISQSGENSGHAVSANQKPPHLGAFSDVWVEVFENYPTTVGFLLDR